MAKASTTATEPVNATAKAPVRDRSQEMVTVKFFKGTGDYAEDITVGLNGRMWRIKRGVEVTIPRSVLEIIETSEKQKLATANLIEDTAAGVANYGDL